MPRSPWTGESGQPIATAMGFAPERRPAARALRDVQDVLMPRSTGMCESGQRRDPGEECGLVAKGSVKKPSKNWSAKVTRESRALELEEGVFTWKDPEKIARSLKNSADSSKHRKAEPFRSAMSMLVFYINRAGKSLDPEQKRVLEKAKQELRKQYGKGQ